MELGVRKGDIGRNGGQRDRERGSHYFNGEKEKMIGLNDWAIK